MIQISGVTVNLLPFNASFVVYNFKRLCKRYPDISSKAYFDVLCLCILNRINAYHFKAIVL